MPERDDDVVMVRRLTRWERLGMAALFLAGVFLVGVAVFVWTGYYNISAKSEHWDFTTEILETVRDQSIHARAGSIAVPDLDNPGMVALGREHYRGGCASCHGMPGEERNPIAREMLPDPPDLAYAFDRYDPSALFWLIDNGIKYTGMPSWPGTGRQDEVWPMVAYLKSVHEENPPGTVVDNTSGDGEPIDSYGFHVLDECSRCHGDAQTGPVSDRVPSLSGQPSDYLERALREYRVGLRESGYMEPAAFALTDQDISQFATLYSQYPPQSGETAFDPEQVARGAEIAMNGLPEDDVPACTSCHGNGNSQFPNLAGQSQTYIEGQLELWRNGGRDTTPYGQIMAVIGRNMSPRQIEDVSAFFASLEQAAPGGGQ
ncbi:c-type cytochrome [Pelagibacterium nitratireducens]|uniref:C-type cytochrome n=1 Tax=Pelagibacterium nitratireducens TaxID=1046114 RepID=A0ABZ2I8A8_9HYPH